METPPQEGTLATEHICTLSTETKKTQANHSFVANAVRTIETTKTNMNSEYELREKLRVIKVWAEHLIENSRPPESPAGESAYYCAKAFLQTELKSIVTEETHK